MDKQFQNIYRNKRVLITGHTGFKGSWLTLWLSELGAEPCGYALEPETDPNHISLIDSKIESHTGDIRDLDKLLAVLNQFRPEIVFHLAAQPLVRLSYREPVETFETNIMGAVNLFEACRQTDSVKAIINITSDKCYENREWVWGYRENDPMGGYDPYSASKGCSEIVTSSYRNSYFNAESYGKEHNVLLASARAGNVIGGADWAEDRLIPDIIKATVNDEKVTIRNPHATRPWQHVLEPLSGYLMLGQKLIQGDINYAEAWNFGPGDEGSLSVGNVITQIKNIWDRVDYTLNTDAKEPHEAKLLKLDCSKAHIKLKWKPVWDSGQTFEKTIEWYKSFYDKNEILSIQDLKTYITDAGKKGLEWAGC